MRKTENRLDYVGAETATVVWTHVLNVRRWGPLEVYRLCAMW